MQKKHKKVDGAMVKNAAENPGKSQFRNSIRGTVFDIQRYSIHDGPGIRTLVFLKGCPLGCQWCSNPESWTPEPQLFYRQSKCIHCEACVREAPKGGIDAEDIDIDGIVADGIAADVSGKLIIDFPALNNQDLSWVKNACPTGALSVKGQEMTVEEIFSIIMKDEIYYRKSGGGITLSGGEPLAQDEFAKAILLKARQNVISTAIETSGYADTETLLSIIPYTDLFLYDFKIFDSGKHRQYTGTGNEIIKTNLKALVEGGAEILVRMPLIPGINDDKDNFDKTLDFLKSIEIRRFTILPYHQYGSGKYQSIGRRYVLDNLRPSKNDLIKKFQNKIVDAGFRLS
jgi:pyruvate formate lyase activating enzyme